MVVIWKAMHAVLLLILQLELLNKEVRESWWGQSPTFP